ncbi:glycoside hydrolase family 88 protein [Pelagicoccus sp. SDUM812003]|uniref:glycoside hydrolase family 88/105 protein n=1 Tax=Pelagicoccus sp. SDUM812003 TaxID=3041267 RepID=UPI00280FA746|nr:glycoside hydrolase family 88 protein [Pelagicoccus sp. SDUM812003]MDQ8202234.1 glycoside hydrolase family 88 protein [Pelagicoccus sp. SDUM812003]
MKTLARTTLATPVSLFKSSLLFAVCLTSFGPEARAQIRGEDASPGVGLWRSDPHYPVPYRVPETEQVADTLARVGKYVDNNCPIRWIDLDTGEAIEAGNSDVLNPGLEYGLFSPISYEWGVTYAGMIRAAEVTGDPFYHDYVKQRLEAIEQIGARYLQRLPEDRPRRYLTDGLIEPHNLDQCGSMTAGIIKAHAHGIGDDLSRFFNPAIDYISNKQMRLADGTFARNRPLPNSLWLDDLYMSVPALAQMGKLTGEHKYFDDACAQIIQMNERMYLPDTGIYRHGWVEDMSPHPSFAWGRANGWTIMATAELLSELPADHPQFDTILSIYQQHIAGIAAHQGIDGFWHQLLDRPETYQETSATAMFVFSLARGINRGWIEASAYAPRAILGWNALSTQIDEEGAIHGTCVGTGIGWDAAFYAYRPVSKHAPHGYGPTILAGAEVLEMLELFGDELSFHDSAIHFGETPDW